MKSIRIKLIIGILLIISTFILGIITYGFTFKSFFQKQKSSEMQKIILDIEDKLNNGLSKDLDDFVATVSDKYSVEIEIQSLENKKIILATYKGGRNFNMMNSVMSHNKFEIIENKELSNHFTEIISNDRSTGVTFLSVVKDTQSFEYQITARVPINIIDDSAKKSMFLLFLIFIPITTFIIIITLIFSRKFTNPIIEITKKANKITNLDFSDSINIKTNDEIGNLGDSINKLSNKIQTTLDELNSKNFKLNEMINKEREEESLRKEFISSVSHELKSPISVISGYAQMLNQGIITSQDDLDYYINVIVEESERMNVIIGDLLDLYKLESNTFKIQMGIINIHELVTKIIKKNSFEFDNQKINLNLNIDEAIIIGDEIRIEQIIQNYLNNALSHVDKNKNISISVKNQDSAVKISIYNSGVAINKKDLNQIWRGFVRLDKVRNYKEKRVGLGLAIVSKIAELHNALYGVTNKEDGVEFWVEFKK